MKTADPISVIIFAVTFLIFLPLAKAGNEPDSVNKRVPVEDENLSDAEFEKQHTEDKAKLLAEADIFSEAYKKATTPAQRMEMCVTAIDKSFNRAGITLEVVERMFGTDAKGWNRYMVQSIRTKESNEKAFIIHFQEFTGSGSKLIPGAWFGWFLYVRYRSDLPEKPMIHYYLSNAWLMTKGFEP